MSAQRLSKSFARRPCASYKRHCAPARPYWAILEDEFECLLVNARHVKQVPGRKTDVSDAAWICSFECTFCSRCAGEVPKGRCPNCGGELVRRPPRAPEKLLKYPASIERVYKPEGCGKRVA